MVFGMQVRLRFRCSSFTFKSVVYYNRHQHGQTQPHQPPLKGRLFALLIIIWPQSLETENSQSRVFSFRRRCPTLAPYASAVRTEEVTIPPCSRIATAPTST